MKKFFTALLAASCICSLTAGENLLKNPGFEIVDAKGKVPNWNLQQYQASGLITIDKENAAEGKQSIQLERLKEEKPFGFVGATQSASFKALPETRKARLSLKVSGVELTGGRLVVYTVDANKKLLLWKTFMQWKGTFEWKSDSVEFDVPAGSIYVAVSLRHSGKGVLWGDDVKLEWVTNGK